MTGGYLQADAYSVYDALFQPVRGLIEVGCLMHARQYFIKALDGLSPRLSAVEDPARGLSGERRLCLRRRLSSAVVEKLNQ